MRQCHPERKGSHGSCYLLTAVAHSAKEMVCPGLRRIAEAYIFLPVCLQPCLEKGCLEHFPCPAPSPKLVLPIHISVKAAKLVSSKRSPAGLSLPRSPTPALPRYSTSFIPNRSSSVAYLPPSNGLQASSISPELKIEPGSHRVLSKCSLREDKCHLVNPCHMQDQVLTEHTV